MCEEMKYVVCFSGGHSSALAAIETVRRYKRKNVILLNHDISSKVEDADTKRFKNEVSEFLGIPITYANAREFESKTPLALCREKNMIRFGAGNSICTYFLKTMPFYQWLDQNYPVKPREISKEITLVYGFDGEEKRRIALRTKVLRSKGYLSEFPLSDHYVLHNIQDIGIQLPETYQFSKHANCKGCLKAGRQHWYMIFCLYPHIFNEAVETEEMIGYSILKYVYLRDLIPLFQRMWDQKIEPNDWECSRKFWCRVKRILGADYLSIG